MLTIAEYYKYAQLATASYVRTGGSQDPEDLFVKKVRRMRIASRCPSQPSYSIQPTPMRCDGPSPTTKLTINRVSMRTPASQQRCSKTEKRTSWRSAGPKQASPVEIYTAI